MISAPRAVLMCRRPSGPHTSAADRARANERGLLRIDPPLSLVASIEEPVEVGVRGEIAVAHQREDLGPMPRLVHERVGLRQPRVFTANSSGVVASLRLGKYHGVCHAGRAPQRYPFLECRARVARKPEHASNREPTVRCRKQYWLVHASSIPNPHPGAPLLPRS